MATWPPPPDPPELQALLDGVHADPDEDAPRLVLADWLDERDDPRGRLLRLIQPPPSRMSDGSDQHAPHEDWLSTYLPDWPGPLPDGWGTHWPHRGLLCLIARGPTLTPLPPAWRAAIRAGWVEMVSVGAPLVSAEEIAEVRPDARRLEVLIARGMWLGSLDLSGWERVHTLRFAWQYGVFDPAIGIRPTLPGSLRVLDLSETVGLTADALQRMQLPGGVRAVDLSGCTDLTGDGLSALSHLADLRHLNLERCSQIGEEGGRDSALTHLESLTALRTLSLRGCWRVGDLSVRSLAGLTNLRTLSLRGCWRVSSAAVAALRKALPRCRVTTGS